MNLRKCQITVRLSHAPKLDTFLLKLCTNKVPERSKVSVCGSKKLYKDRRLQRLSEIGTENALWKTQLHLKLNGTRLMVLMNVGEILNWRLGKKTIQL